LTSRVCQHELDHLNGILCYDRANKYHRDMAFRKRHNLERKLKRVKPNE
ncbi:MAG: peptide deformylase, partial [bacterium]